MKRPIAAGEHDKSIKPDGDARTSRQSRFMGREQPFVHVRNQSSRPAPRLDIAPYPSMQLDCIPEFVVAVGNFDSVDIQLEPLGNLWRSRAYLCKRRLGRREIEQVDTSGAERGLHRGGKEMVEAFVAGGGHRSACESTRLARVVKFRHRRGERIEFEMAGECLPESHLPGRSRTENAVEQCVDIPDEEVMVESDPVPFENRELRVVVSAALAIPECPGDLVDGPASRREQSFHRELGRCLKVPGTSPALVCNEALNRRVGDRAGAQYRGFDFQDTLGIEVRTHAAQDGGSQSNCVDTCARTPVAA